MGNRTTDSPVRGNDEIASLRVIVKVFFSLEAFVDEAR